MTVLRYITPDNANILGYDPAEYSAGAWVLETEGGEWMADVATNTANAWDAMRAAAAHLGYQPEDWHTMPTNYGTAYTTDTRQVTADPDPGRVTPAGERKPERPPATARYLHERGPRRGAQVEVLDQRRGRVRVRLIDTGEVLVVPARQVRAHAPAPTGRPMPGGLPTLGRRH